MAGAGRKPDGAGLDGDGRGRHGGGRARDTRSGLALHGSGKGSHGPGPRPRGLARREPGAVAARSGADRGEAEGARHPAVAALRLLRTAPVRAWCGCRHATFIEPLCGDIAPGSVTCYSIQEADGLGENRGHG